jgi:hypothetical protein
MSDEAPKVTKKLTKTQHGKWTRAQALGFWFLLTAVAMFWSGVYLGGLNATNYHNDIEKAKSSAIEQSVTSTSKQ